jgi:chromosome segregation ATPase
VTEAYERLQREARETAAERDALQAQVGADRSRIAALVEHLERLNSNKAALVSTLGEVSQTCNDLHSLLSKVQSHDGPSPHHPTPTTAPRVRNSSP